MLLYIIPIAVGLIAWVASGFRRERKLEFRIAVSISCLVIAAIAYLLIDMENRIQEAYRLGYQSGSESSLIEYSHLLAQESFERISELEDVIREKENVIYQFQNNLNETILQPSSEIATLTEQNSELYLQLQNITTQKNTLRQEIQELESLLDEYIGAETAGSQGYPAQGSNDTQYTDSIALPLREANIVNSQNWGTGGVPLDSLGRNHAHSQFVIPGYGTRWQDLHSSRNTFADVFLDGQYSRLRGTIVAHQGMHQNASGTVKISVYRGRGWEVVYTSNPITRLTTGEPVNVLLGDDVVHVQIQFLPSNRGLPIILVDWEFYN